MIRTTLLLTAVLFGGIWSIATSVNEHDKAEKVSFGMFGFSLLMMFTGLIIALIQVTVGG